ncbi:holo-ACP synthase [Bacillus testis]|uniref:holo-ACP synthase n=1 Tax=Bacillus testis TaxID=1622072 RepID=UPI00067F4A60|nr:holo-ACP synthase [Bacillus testis]
MIKGIGMDIVEITRIGKLLEHQPKFVRRVLTDSEFETYQSLKGHRQIEFLAGRFAAKEAFSKAFGTGIGEQLGFHDIEIQYGPFGKPVIAKPFAKGAHLSITHSKDYAAAQVVLEE